MTGLASEVGHLKIRACLLLLACLWQWTQQTLATPCQDGELRIIGKDEKKCCPKCSSDAGDNSTCQNVEDPDCKCRQGYSCSDSECLYCEKLPECAEGEELVKLGILDFIFKCKPCEIGTYSNVKNGWCRNWTDCESSGFLTIKQGNSTHNAVCGFPSKDVEQVPVAKDSLYTTILAILTAVAVFVLILLTFFLHFCIWSLKKEKYHTADGCRGLHNCHTIEKRLTAASFQKKNMETKHQKKSLAFSTLRVHNENSSIAICCENGKPSSAFQGKKKGGAGQAW
ncbi:tumor necrosis factor receptor superfamily member 18 isoform X2 [Chroicocephalus ridibundus]|uniref:tumor necrosis factor receptor superfamily member 18 isoform X2 n=1 Tax=Chroicocephalus ridibundus TaxID=1192867 RepID=UPI002FDEB905